MRPGNLMPRPHVIYPTLRKARQPHTMQDNVMALNQDRIEGDYTLVSTDRPGGVLGEHTMAAVRAAWAAGCAVALAVGVWNNVHEETLVISGPGHATLGRSIARLYEQDAYVIVGDGVATVWERDGAGYASGATYTRQVSASGQASYTVLPGGRAVCFA